MTQSSATDISLEWVGALPLFHDLLPRELERAHTLLVRRKVAVATELMKPDDGGDALYFLHQGALRVAAVQGEHEMILGIRGPGTTTGALSIFDGGELLRVTAQTPCDLAVLSRFDFWNSIWPMPAVPFNVAHLLAERLRERNAQILEMGTLDVPARIARQVARLSREHGQVNPDGTIELPFPLTQAELAQMVGTSRVHVNQTLARWNQGQALSFRRGKLVVHQPQMLYRMAAIG